MRAALRRWRMKRRYGFHFEGIPVRSATFVGRQTRAFASAKPTEEAE